METEQSIATPAKVLVVGMGISGRSVCELLLRQGVNVVATDLRHRTQFNGSLDHLEQMGCSFRLGRHAAEDFLGVDQIIVSPGIPLDIEPLRKAAAKGIQIIGELDWAWRHVNLPALAITGTNGKTTTTSLVGEMLKQSGKHPFVGGNIGTPLSQWLLDGEPADSLVLEVSSFQLDTARQFHPQVGVLLNITEDHLDRYDNFAAYADSKFSLFSRQTTEEVAIINVDDPICLKRYLEVPGRVLISSREDGSANAFIREQSVLVNIPGREPFSLALDHSALRGVHNEEDILAAVLAASSFGASVEAMQKVIDSFRGLPHRMEWVRNWNGVDFYDDSKGTNVGAVVKALENFDRPVLLLLGGRDKQGSYKPLVEPMARTGKAVFAFGEAAPRIQEDLGDQLHTLVFLNLEEAVSAAVSEASSGNVVLLSPACSSFDQYDSYAQRGDHFKNLVNRLGSS